MSTLKGMFYSLAPVFIIFSAFALSVVSAQQPAAIQGDYIGTLGPLNLKLHIVAAADGTLTGTLDSPAQGAIGLPCTEFRLEGKTLSFKVPVVTGSWTGTIESNGALSGSWTQGAAAPLTFTRDNFVPAAKASRVDGIWLGTLLAQGQRMRGQIVVKSNDKGEEFCALDNPDSGAFDIPCANVVLAIDSFDFDIPLVGGHWSGKLSADGNSLTGTWTQKNPATGASVPAQALNFTRQTKRLTPEVPPPATYDTAIDPVSAAGMEAVLRRDLEKALSAGLLASGKPTGVSVGVVRDGVRRVFTLGTAKQDSLFEIGSITKTFTGLVLAQMIAQGDVELGTPVRTLLPKDIVAKPSGDEITLLDLVTQHSGLPRMPDNFMPSDPDNPYADYRPANLYEFIGKHGVAKPAGAEFLYSNLGLGLLGQALANRAQTSYPELLKRSVLDPLNLTDTTVKLSPDQERRFIQGHSVDLRPVHAWDIDALAGAGAIRSTADDMLKYLEANLHPEQIAARPASSASARTISAALTQSHELRADVGPEMKIGFAWLNETNSGDFWHNGGTGGFTSFAFFNPKGNYAGVVLVNVTLGGSGSFADSLGKHISERFAGKPALSLSDWGATRNENNEATKPNPELEATLETYVGVYPVGPAITITVTREGSRLFFQATNQPRRELLQEKRDEFIAKDVPVQIVFTRDASGKVTGLIRRQNGVERPATKQ